VALSFFLLCVTSATLWFIFYHEVEEVALSFFALCDFGYFVVKILSLVGEAEKKIALPKKKKKRMF
jgi:hypothetical protein